MKLRIKSMIWNLRKQKNNHAEQQEEKRIQTNEDSVSCLWDNFKCTNSHIRGVLEGEEKEQEIEILFEKTMKENFPNMVKEIDIQVQEAQSPNQDAHKEDHTTTYHN